MTALLTIADLVSARAAGRGDHAFFVWGDERLTFAEAEAASRHLARALLAIGATRGSRIGLLYPNGVDYVLAFLAITRIGAVAVPISTFSTADEIGWLLRNADIELLLSAPGYRNRDFAEILRQAVPGFDASGNLLRTAAAPALRRIHIAAAGADRRFAGLTDATGLAPSTLVDATGRGVTPGDRMVIVHTSGSTSDPKGVMHTHGGVLRHIANLNRVRSLGPDDVLFSLSPFFWIGGLVYSLLGAMEAGARLVGSGSSDAGEMLDLIERERPTICNGFAAGVAHYADHPSFGSRDLGFLRRGNLYPIMAPEVRPADPLLRHAMLGTTETASLFLVTDDEVTDLPERLRGSFGWPAPEAELRIVDPETGQDCATGGIGEMWVRGPFVMEGYYGREVQDCFTPDGWYNTGDLACRNEEGIVFFKGRNNDMIKTAGANVSPREVEQALAAATGKTAYVVGIPDAVRGQTVAAGIVGGTTEDIDLSRLKPVLAAGLSSFKIPRKIVALDQGEIPMLSSGKVNLRALTELIDGR